MHTFARERQCRYVFTGLEDDTKVCTAKVSSNDSISLAIVIGIIVGLAFVVTAVGALIYCALAKTTPSRTSADLSLGFSFNPSRRNRSTGGRAGAHVDPNFGVTPPPEGRIAQPPSYAEVGAAKPPTYSVIMAQSSVDTGTNL